MKRLSKKLAIRARALLRAWRNPAFPKLPQRRQRVTAAIMTRNSAERLPRLVSQLYAFVDEIIIGVDASSTDSTWRVARRWGDRVYRFSLSGHTAPARELAFEYATGDWILSIDDDELLEENFGEIVRDLIQRPGLTHAWVPRKWIVGQDPCRFLYEPPWYPDWQLRLFRNQKSLAYKPSAVHTGYRVLGPGIRETRAHLLHLEPLLLDAEGRRRKIERYRALGSSSAADLQFQVPPGAETRPTAMPRIRHRRPAGRGKTDKQQHRLPEALPWRWKAEVLSIDAVPRIAAGAVFIATIRVKNTGSLAWMPYNGSQLSLNLGNHLRDAHGNMLQFDRDRASVVEPVPPGTMTVFHVPVQAPTSPGTFIFEWDMISEGECWFAEAGGKSLSHTLIVE